MARITLTLNDDEKTALRYLAEKEYRDPRLQAALIIRKELEKQGLITINNPHALEQGAAEENKISKQENRNGTK
jgi:hypothetical protein